MEQPDAAGGSDTDLIHRARQGDGAAWEALVHTHQEPVFRFAYLLLGDPDDAEDAAQETFIRAYRALERFDPARPLRPWLMSIAANLARNRRRSMGRYLAAAQRLFRAAPLAHPTAEELHTARWEAETVWRAIRKLDESDQQVVYLRYFLEMKTEEVAEILHIPPGTVKSRLHRTLAKLRLSLAGDFPALDSPEPAGSARTPQPPGPVERGER